MCIHECINMSFPHVNTLVFYFPHESWYPVCFLVSDSDASDCQYVIHKKVGDTVELSSDVKNETLSTRGWKYGEKKIVDGDLELPENQFKDRMNLNKQNFNLTVKKLTLNDSGQFFFISSSNNSQRPTVCVNLRVHGKTPLFSF